MEKKNKGNNPLVFVFTKQKRPWGLVTTGFNKNGSFEV